MVGESPATKTSAVFHFPFASAVGMGRIFAPGATVEPAVVVMQGLDILCYVIDHVCMREKRELLSGVLNLRVDDALSREIDRIAAVEETSASEAARELLGFGVEVQRQIEASYLRLPYTLDRTKTDGHVVIEAAWKPYTARELWELASEERAAMDEAEEYGGRY